MNINVLTIFPEIFEILNSGVISKAMKKDILSIKAFDIRKNATNKHKNVDSKPYGGGEGMVIMAEPLIKTIKSIDKRKIPMIQIMRNEALKAFELWDKKKDKIKY